MLKSVNCVFKKSVDVKHVISLNDAGGLVRCYGHTDASAIDLAVRYYEGERGHKCSVYSRSGKIYG